MRAFSPPPVSDALSMPPNANEATALLIIEPRGASSKCTQQMSPVPGELDMKKLINKESLWKYRWMRPRRNRGQRC